MNTKPSILPSTDPFEPVPLRDNFYQSCAFFPLPFALITTTNERGFTSIGPYALQFPLQIAEHYSMLLVTRAGSNTAINLRRNGKCALNYIEFDKGPAGICRRARLPGRAAGKENGRRAFHDDQNADTAVL